MAKPMFFYAGVYDSSADAELDYEAIERAAVHAKDHTLKREFGDWDEAEQDALESIARAEQHAVV
jgi:hypothetical protein